MASWRFCYERILGVHYRSRLRTFRGGSLKSIEYEVVLLWGTRLISLNRALLLFSRSPAPSGRTPLRHSACLFPTSFLMSQPISFPLYTSSERLRSISHTHVHYPSRFGGFATTVALMGSLQESCGALPIRQPLIRLLIPLGTSRFRLPLSLCVAHSRIEGDTGWRSLGLTASHCFI